MQESIISDWKPEYAENFGAESLLLHHRLSETGLFTHDALAELIDSYPQETYNLNTMGYDPENPEWREGIIKNTTGKDVIQAIQQGRMWLNLRMVESVDPRYGKLLNDIFDEFAEYVPGFKTFKRKFGILISSPKVQVFYHADVPGQSLWQVEGKKRVYVYPNRAPFLAPKHLEGIILGETEEEIPYDPNFDDDALVYDLKPGEMVHWPLNCPHRVVNEDCLNVSVTTEHWTDDIRKSFAVNYANGVLRRTFGMKDLSQSIDGSSVYAKAALAVVWRKLKLDQTKKVVRMVDFTLDPKAETGIVDIPAYAK
ncbi:MAG: hypothetical protein AAGA53_05005 [Pseudomonadota bacterium]